jgi:uncharacterized protein (DUF1697 family)
MKQYIVLLRGVNISGKNKIGMPVLKKELEDAGFSDVLTYLNSGNILLSAENGNLRKQIEEIIKDKFDLDIPVYVIEKDKLKDLLRHAPSWWNSGDKARYDNLIFILSNDRPEDICELIGEPSEGLEEIQICDTVIFWTFDRTRYQKCNWWKKTASNGIAEKLTIRTANTVLKLCGTAEGKDR